MYQALYRSERPETFSQVIGQKHVVSVLKNQIANDQVAHAYIFSGTRGTGKTTMARILAKAVNCTEQDAPCGVCDTCQSIKNGTYVDVIELDAASNNGIDNIRDLRESINFPPVAGKKKVYIIDEAHMLSNQAFNALLKTLEEPPEYVIIILATTDPQKLPATILSRCQRLEFRPIADALMEEYLKDLLARKGVAMENEAISLIVRRGEGSVRDTLSILEQTIAAGKTEINEKYVLDLLGIGSMEFFVRLTDEIAKGNGESAIELIDAAIGEGKEPYMLMKDLLKHFRNLMVALFLKEPSRLIHGAAKDVEMVKRQAMSLEPQQIEIYLEETALAVDRCRLSSQKSIALEVLVLRLCRGLKAIQIKEFPHQKKQQGENEASYSSDVAGNTASQAIASEESLKKEPCIELEKVKEVWPRIVSMVSKFFPDLNEDMNKCNIVQVKGQDIIALLPSVEARNHLHEESGKIRGAVKKLFGEDAEIHFVCTKEETKSIENADSQVTNSNEDSELTNTVHSENEADTGALQFGPVGTEASGVKMTGKEALDSALAASEGVKTIEDMDNAENASTVSKAMELNSQGMQANEDNEISKENASQSSSINESADARALEERKKLAEEVSAILEMDVTI